MELRKILPGNVWKIARLKVARRQEDFVATNAQSILEAFATREAGGVALPFALYEGEQPVGFVMFGYGVSEDEDEEPAAAADGYCIWRLMIDEAQQGKGYGKAAMAASLAYLATKPCGPASCCWLSYEPENAAAKALYAAFGFEETGEICGGEAVAVRPL